MKDPLPAPHHCSLSLGLSIKSKIKKWIFVKERHKQASQLCKSVRRTRFYPKKKQTQRSNLPKQGCTESLTLVQVLTPITTGNCSWGNDAFSLWKVWVPCCIRNTDFCRIELKIQEKVWQLFTHSFPSGQWCPWRHCQRSVKKKTELSVSTFCCFFFFFTRA